MTFTMSHPPRNRHPPKHFWAMGSSSESDVDELSGVNFMGAVTPPTPSTAASSQATSLSCASSPGPLPVPLPQKQLEGSLDSTQELSDWEKFDIHYGMATKDQQEVLGMYLLHNIKCG